MENMRMEDAMGPAVKELMERMESSCEDGDMLAVTKHYAELIRNGKTAHIFRREQTFSPLENKETGNGSGIGPLLLMFLGILLFSGGGNTQKCPCGCSVPPDKKE